MRVKGTGGGFRVHTHTRNPSIYSFMAYTGAGTWGWGRITQSQPFLKGKSHFKSADTTYVPRVLGGVFLPTRAFFPFWICTESTFKFMNPRFGFKVPNSAHTAPFEAMRILEEARI